MKTIKFLPKKLIIITLLLLCVLHTVPSAAAVDESKALAAVLVETTSGEVLFSENADVRVYPASTTKIMTALLVIEAISSGTIAPDDMVTAQASAMEGLLEDGSTADIQAGEALSVRDLLYCTLISSANEACNILAEFVAGDIGTFVGQMNERAAKLGCTGTLFANAHGLPNDGHYTTAWDLYLIASEAVRHELFMEIADTAEMTIAATNLSEARELITTNSLINPDSAHYREYAHGLKTGYTKSAGNCLVSTARVGEMNVLSVVMGVGLESEDAEEISSFTVATQLYDWAFESYELVEVLSVSETIASIPVSKARDADAVFLRAADSLTLLLPTDHNAQDIQRHTVIYSQQSGETLTAPIAAGTILGELTITYDGKTYGPINLVTNTEVALSSLEHMKGEVLKTLTNPFVIIAIILLLALFIFYVVSVTRHRRRRKSTRAVGRYRGKNRRG